MRNIETTVAPAEFYGKSARRLYVNMHRLTVGVTAWAHTNGRLVVAQEMIEEHDVIEGFDFEHDMLQPGQFARHARRESHAVMTLVAAQEAQANFLVDVDPITQTKAQHAGVEIMRALRVRYRKQHMAQAQNTQFAGIAHRILVDFKAIRQLNNMTIGVGEFDEIDDAPFGAFFRASAAPIDSFSCELGLPLGKLFSAADIETDVLQNRLHRRICRDAMWILIGSQIGNSPVGRSAGGKSQEITRKIFKFFAIRHTDADLHDILDCRHGTPSLLLVIPLVTSNGDAIVRRKNCQELLAQKERLTRLRFST